MDSIAYQNLNGIFSQKYKKDSKIHMESQKTSNSQNITEKELSWRPHIFSFQNILQSYSDQKSIILA